VSARPAQRLEAGELALVRWKQADLEDLERTISANLEHLRPWMPWASDLASGARAGFLREAGEGWAAGSRFEYAIRDRAGALIGSIGMIRRIGPGGLEIGYWVAAAHTRRGVATLAAAALTDAALQLADVDRVQIHHDRANTVSGKIPARLGFRRVGAFPRSQDAPGDSGIDVRWRMGRAEYPSSAARALLDAARAPARHRR
jgi:RimJ/RimL family protein N-acetyltransferase